ncbi:MAG TPA: nucleoside hydrolase [bacterium]|nr:nucleoside hydrolase [bacterium]HPN43085.1 nucleoside hydrolase [bacterium]
MKRIYLSVLLILCLLSAASSAEKQKVIFDCDLGDDIDDAFALSLLLASPELEVLGLVMDYGNTPKRAQIACRMLYETGLEHIPVIVGRKTVDNYSPQFIWGEGFDKIKPVNTNAADFIIQNLKKYPNEVILFTVGPVPNMQDILKKDPDALKLAKHVYSMFGSFYMGYGTGPIPEAEWNVRADLDAAKAFVASGARITYAGLDITTFVKWDAENRLKLLMRQSPLTSAICSLYTLWGYETPTLFDCVAVGMLLWPDLFTTRPACVKVIGDGLTVIDESGKFNCEIGISINKEEFLKRLLDRYVKQNLGRKVE